MKRLPILTYHSLDDSGSAISITPTLFRLQMEHLRRNGWRTLCLDELLEGHAQGEWPARSLLLTFDDGYKNFVESGLPVLVGIEYTALVFVVAGRLGSSNDWPGQLRWVPRRQLMDWTDLKAIAGAGMEIGAHSMSHPHLPRSPIDQARREVVDSRSAIQGRIAGPVDAFAYPYGETSPELEEIVRSEFRAGFGTRLAFADSKQRASSFNRIDAFYLREPRLFYALESGWLDLYLSLRRWFRLIKPVSR